MTALLLVLSALAAGDIHRCGLESLPKGWTPDPPPTAASPTSEAARIQADAVSSLQTDHFVLWWTSVGTDAIRGAAPNAPLAGDNVPALARNAANALESAWHLYVDSLKYPAPRAASQGYHWKIASNGKYPVEICTIASSYPNLDTHASYYGLTVPYADRSSFMLLASDLHSFGGWSYRRDTDNGLQGSDYTEDWAIAMQATAAHELFHAVQFNYETNLEHFLFESSAVAMEKVAVPTESDYLAYASPGNGGLCDVADLTSLLDASFSTAYPHAWYVQQIMGDFGRDVLRKLWESRAGSSAPIKTTLRRVLGTYGSSFDTTLARYALRLGLSGRRNGWLLPAFASFSDARFFPTLYGSLKDTSSPREVFLDSGAIQEWIDTAGNAADRIVNWIPDAGAGLGHAWKSGSASGAQWLCGSVRQAASRTRQDVWSLFNPGPRSALVSTATSEASNSWLWTTAAPDRTSVKAGKALRWQDSGGTATLSGVGVADTVCTPLLHTDIWKPVQTEDPFAYSVSGRGGGHAFVLEDADHVLGLTNAALVVPFGSLSTVWIGRGDGVWTKASSTPSGAATTIALDSLDLATPLRILAAPGNSPASVVRVPYPNPSRATDYPALIHFPISAATEEAQLLILSSDGTVVRRLKASSGMLELDWDVKNSSGRRVRPGVYWYVWRGVSGTGRGELLIAD